MSVLVVALAAFLAAQGSTGVKWRPLTSPPPSVKKPSKPTIAPPTNAAVVPALATPAIPAMSPHTAATGTGPQRLDLTCTGAGTANKATGAFINSGSVWATITGTRDRGFSDQVDVRLFAGDDRIRMPRTMLPGLRGGSEGWFKLKNVVADARSIRASAAVNIINNPKVFIDRVTGTISISGKAGDYSGQCQVIDPTAAPKF